MPKGWIVLENQLEAQGESGAPDTGVDIASNDTQLSDTVPQVGVAKRRFWRDRSKATAFVAGVVTSALIVAGVVAARTVFADDGGAAGADEAGSRDIDAVAWIDERAALAARVGDTVRVGRFDVESLEPAEANWPVQDYRAKNISGAPLLASDLGFNCAVLGRASELEPHPGPGFQSKRSRPFYADEQTLLKPGETVDFHCGVGGVRGIAEFYDLGLVTDQKVIGFIGGQRIFPTGMYAGQTGIDIKDGESIAGSIRDGEQVVGSLSDLEPAQLGWERVAMLYSFSEVLAPGKIFALKISPSGADDSQQPGFPLPPDDGFCSSPWTAAPDSPVGSLGAVTSLSLERSGPVECLISDFAGVSRTVVLGQAEVKYFQFERPDPVDEDPTSPSGERLPA